MANTELNRAVAKKLGWDERRAPDGYLWEHPDYDFAAGYIAFCDGVAWADSADVALAELWPLVKQKHKRAEITGDDNGWFIVAAVQPSIGVDLDTGVHPTLAIAICKAFLEDMRNE